MKNTMKNTFLKTIGAAALAFLMLAMFAQIPVSAQIREEVPIRNQRDLEGTWDLQVTRRNCQTGAAFATFASIETFMSGGTMLDSTSAGSPALITPGHGVWSHAGGRNYRFKFKAFQFDVSGNFTGWIIVSHQPNLNRRADKFESAGTSEFYNAQGVLLFTGCSTLTATRFE